MFQNSNHSLISPTEAALQLYRRPSPDPQSSSPHHCKPARSEVVAVNTFNHRIMPVSHIIEAKKRMALRQTNTLPSLNRSQRPPQHSRQYETLGGHAGGAANHHAGGATHHTQQHQGASEFPLMKPKNSHSHVSAPHDTDQDVYLVQSRLTTLMTSPTELVYPSDVGPGHYPDNIPELSESVVAANSNLNHEHREKPVLSKYIESRLSPSQSHSRE